MRYICIPAAALALATGPVAAQNVLDVAALQELDEADIVSADGTEIGEIEEVLIDENGRVVAVVAEVGGLLDIGDEDVIFVLDQLTYQNGDYVTQLSQEEIEALPRYD